MTDILRLKFTQNPDLANLLVATGQLHLHEATADPKWATGAELSSKATLTGQWGGSDKMGSLLDQLRSELREDTDLPPTNSSPLPLEGDDILPMPDDQGDNNTTPDPPTPLNPHSSPTPHLSQHSLPQTVPSHHSPTHHNKQSNPQPRAPTHLNQAKHSVPPTPVGVTQNPDKPVYIQPLMQCKTTSATIDKISARAPAAQHTDPPPPLHQNLPSPQTTTPNHLT